MLLACVLMLTSCQYDPYAHLYTTTKPAEADVVGTYTFTQHTMPVTLACRGTIELRADGTYDLRDVQAWTATTPGNFGPDKIVMQQGKWRIESVGTIGGNGPNKTAWGILLDPPLDTDSSFHLLNPKSPYTLQASYGDPDGGYMMRFERK